jgi:cell filamentation protein
MDPYVYPGTNVLRNLRDIRNENLLSEFEAEASARRLRQLEHKPMLGAFDAQHVQAIHRHIFKDVYAWAGEFRTVNISKSGNPFAFTEYIASSLNKTLKALESERYLGGADPKRFTNRGAYYLGEINAIHPFREGNGRAQREFIRELAVRNGYTLNWSRVSREEMIEASRQSFRGDNVGLEHVLTSALG